MPSDRLQVIVELPHRVIGKQRLRGCPKRRYQLSYLGLLLIQLSAKFVGMGPRVLRLFSFPARPALGSLPAAGRSRMPRGPDEFVVVEGEALRGLLSAVPLVGDPGSLLE